MKIEAHNIEELFKASEDKEALMRELDKIITSNAPGMERQLYAANSITMIGYGILPYHTKSYNSWPVIALAPQKNSVNLYMSALKDGRELTLHYKEKLGKISMGKGCIRIPKLEKVDVGELKNMIRDAVEWYLIKTK